VREILPNALPPIVVRASLTIGTAIPFEVGCRSLGLADRSVMSWGYMIGSSRLYRREAWWTVTLPGLAIIAAGAEPRPSSATGLTTC
jgi:peptide/nickel transport system permease protein